MRFEECESLLSIAPLPHGNRSGTLISGGCTLQLCRCWKIVPLICWPTGLVCRPDTDEYRLWHPGAHLYSEWAEIQPGHKDGCVEGTTHKAREMMAGSATEATLMYLDPYELFGDKLTKAKEQGEADVVLYSLLQPWRLG